VSEGLHRILSVRYRGHASSSQIDFLKTEIAPQFEVSSTEPKTAKNVPLTVASSHLNLHRLPAQIALFRPDTYISATEKIREAADLVNGILEKSMADGTAPFSAPTIVPLIVPALYTHLMAAREREEMKRQLGKHKLDFGLIFLKTLELNYHAAAIVKKLFETALAVRKKERKTERQAVSTDKGDQAADEISLDGMQFPDIDPSLESSSFGYSPSGFTLLPTQGALLDMGFDEIDR
jgi:hypothetical protein